MTFFKVFTLRALMSTTVDILCFIISCITTDNKLSKIIYTFNFETLMSIGT